MHDINFIRENPDLFDELLKKRYITSKSSEIISLDTDKTCCKVDYLSVSFLL